MPDSYQLTDGSRIAVIGGGPAGSFFSILLLDLASQQGLAVQVDIFEPRDYSVVGPVGCNMCGGIISETLVQQLIDVGIGLPPSVVQRGIDSYTLQMDVGKIKIGTSRPERHIGAVYRGAGPRDTRNGRWASFDGYLQQIAIEKGAHWYKQRVDEFHWRDGFPYIQSNQDEPIRYDLLVVAAGINTSFKRLLANQSLPYRPPQTARTFIHEYYLGEEQISSIFGSSMQVFLLDLPRLEFAAIIPKGDYVSICLLGDNIDQSVVQAFMNAPEVKRCFPKDWDFENQSCTCAPRINIKGAVLPYGNRIVFIGDCSVTRLYKDGIGAAYFTAKAAASCAVLNGISTGDFAAHYWPLCWKLEADNRVGRLIFWVVRQVQTSHIARRAVLRMLELEQEDPHSSKRMSTMLWDLFTGSAPYVNILRHMLHPTFWLRFLLAHFR